MISEEHKNMIEGVKLAMDIVDSKISYSGRDKKSIKSLSKIIR